MKSLRILFAGMFIALASVILSSCHNEPTTYGATETQHRVSMIWECKGNMLHIKLINESGTENIGTRVILNDIAIATTNYYPFETDYKILDMGEQRIFIQTGQLYDIENGEVVFTGPYEQSSISRFMMNTADN